MKPPYPRDIDALLAPVRRLLRAVVRGRPLPRWRGARLVAPVGHVALQPADKVARMADRTPDERLADVVELAFQLGVCQGYALRGQEVDARRAIEDIGRRLDGGEAR